MKLFLLGLFVLLMVGSSGVVAKGQVPAIPRVKVTWVKADLFEIRSQTITPEVGGFVRAAPITGSFFIFADLDGNPEKKENVMKFINISGDAGYEKFSWLRFRIEVSGDPHKVLAVKVGPIIRLPETPIVGKLVKRGFVVLNVAYHAGAGGSAPDHELYILYGTKPIRLGGVGFTIAGFQRIRAGNNFGQPQLIISHPKLGPLQGVVEGVIVGRRVAWYGGIKIDLLKLF